MEECEHCTYEYECDSCPYKSYGDDIEGWEYYW